MASLKTNKVLLFQSLRWVLVKFCQEEVILPKCSEFSDSKNSMRNSKAKSVMAPALSSPFPGPYRTANTWQ